MTVTYAKQISVFVPDGVKAEDIADEEFNSIIDVLPTELDGFDWSDADYKVLD